MTRRSTKIATIALFLTLTGGACASEAEDAAPAETSAAEEVAATDDVVVDTTSDDVDAGETASQQAVADEDGSAGSADLDDIERLWIEGGTDPELASCYSDVLADADIDEVADLNELAEVMGNLNASSKRAMDNCLG